MVGILGANSVSGGYEIDNSLRFNKPDTAVLRKTFSGSPTATQKCTFSFWTKLADPSVTTSKTIFSAIKSGSDEDIIQFHGINNGIHSGFELAFNNGNDGVMYIGTGGNTLVRFRDPSAWYHFVIAIDSTQGTASNRVKVYVNGVQNEVESRIDGGAITTDVPLTQNYALGFLTASAHSIGENVESAGTTPYDGYLADFNFIDGTQNAPTDFGETDDNGVWIPIKYTGSYGNYGFFMEFKQTGTGTNASGMGADTSGNGNHFAPVNLAATDVTTDTPTNNFATLNPLDGGQAAVTLEECNTLLNMGSWSSWGYTASTFYPTSGKWYLETKLSSTSAWFIGVVEDDNTAFYNLATAYPTSSNGGYALYSDGRKAVAGSGLATYTVDCRTAGAIIGMAIDLDNNRLYFSKNNGWSDGDGSADASTPNAYLTLPANKTFRIIWSSDGVDFSVNFGNPPYANSSSASDANSYGDFEYAPPSGYYSLCTKNLAEFG